MSLPLMTVQKPGMTLLARVWKFDGTGILDPSDPTGATWAATLPDGQGWPLAPDEGQPGSYSAEIPTPIEAWPDGTDVRIYIVDAADRIVEYQPARVYQGIDMPPRGGGVTIAVNVNR
jgi:hypothetical protein